MSANLEDPEVTIGLEKVDLHPSSKEGSTRECANHWTVALISHASKVMLKILHARLQNYANQEIPDVQAGFRKGRGTRDQIANIHWVIEKAREFQKNIFDCMDHDKLWKALWETTHWTSPWCWERLRAEGEVGVREWEGWTASPMQWTRTWANFRKFGEGQRRLVCCSPWDHKESDTTERLNWTDRATEQQQQNTCISLWGDLVSLLYWIFQTTTMISFHFVDLWFLSAALYSFQL